jgi:probable F420-dependent oxidoreductase
VKVDVMLPAADLDGVGALAREAERLGFHGLLVPEARHDPFLALTMASEHTNTVEIGTFLAEALPRSPMHLAQVSHDLQMYCQGRLTIGLGAGNRVELEERFGVDGSRAAARLREMVLALRAIWRAWNEGAPLHFEGEFYRHTLMTPAFDPGPTGWGPPRICVSAEGAEMVEVAGEVADGLILPGQLSPRHLGDVIQPALEQGLRRAGRMRGDIEVSAVVATRQGFLAAFHEGIGPPHGDLADRIVISDGLAP